MIFKSISKSIILISTFACSTILVSSQEPVEIKWGLADRIGRRKTMEDTHCAINAFLPGTLNGFFGIFDGHGGSTVAEHVSGHLATNLSQLISSNMCQPRNDFHLIRLAFEQTDNELRGKNNRGIEKNFCKGCTAVTAWVLNECTAHIAWLGDSRAVLINNQGKVEWTSQDHKPNEPNEQLRIEANNGIVECINGIPRLGKNGQVPALAVARAFGDFIYKNGKGDNQVSIEPSIITLCIKSDDFLIFACDGVWDVVSHEKAAEIVHSTITKQDKLLAMKHLNEHSQTTGNSEPLKLAAQKLRDYAFDHGSRDNISVMIIQLPGKKQEIISQKKSTSLLNVLINNFNSLNTLTKCAIVGTSGSVIAGLLYYYYQNKK